MKNEDKRRAGERDREECTEQYRYGVQNTALIGEAVLKQRTRYDNPLCSQISAYVRKAT